MIVLGHKPERQRNAICIEAKWRWGASFNMGMFIFISKNCRSSIPHEYGHSIQGLIWGPLWWIVIAIPSAARCGLRDLYYKYRYPKTRKALPPYDSIWFEGQATNWGERAFANEWKWL